MPHVAKGWEHSDDYREWTFFLRRGMKWSDGHPFTSEDIRYWWEEEVLNETVGGTKKWYQVRVSHFADKNSARTYGEALKAKGIIDDFGQIDFIQRLPLITGFVINQFQLFSTLIDTVYATI